MNNFKVSVIVPVYNAGEYIFRCLNSIINQDFHDYELIIINDGSTDSSLEIIEDTLKDTTIEYKILKQENQGVSQARNRGIDEARGEYLVFVDADDYVEKNHLSNLYNGKSDFSLTQFVKKNRDSTSNIYVYEDKTIKTDDFIKMELQGKIPFHFAQLMYKTSIIKQNNIYFLKDVVYGEDTVFALEALIHGADIAVNNEITYYYMQNPSSAIQTSQYRRFEIVGIFEKLKEVYEKNNRNDLAEMITTSRIPRAIFANMNFFFHNNYDFQETLNKMKELDLLTKLSKYHGDFKFKLKIKLFLSNPKAYYKMWMKLKNSID